MTYAEALKNGFGLINRRWQLIALQAGILLLNCLLFVVVVGIPLGIAFVIFGLDLTSLAQDIDIRGLLQNPKALLTKYAGLVVFVLSSFLVYAALISTLGLFVFGGTAGMIRRGILDPASRFRMRDFIDEGKRSFFPLMWFSLVMGLIFIAIAFLLGLMGGGIAAVISYAKSQDSTLALFLGIFFSLAAGLIAISLFLAALAVTVYGVAALLFRQEGAARAVRRAASLLMRHQHAFWLYALLFAGYLGVSFLFMLLVFPFKLVPIIGSIVTFPLQLLSSVVQSYLGLVLIAAIFIYYRSLEEAEAGQDDADGDSTHPADTSGQQAEGPEPSPRAGEAQAGD